MKKLVYSGALKFIAALLLIFCMVGGVICAADGIIAFYAEEDNIYSFEEDFSKSWYMAYLLSEPENALYHAYLSTFHGYDIHGKPAIGDVTEQRKTLEENIRKALENIYHADKIEYFVQWNDLTVTNCGAASAEALMDGEYYSCVTRDAAGTVERVSSGSSAVSRGYLIEDIDEFDESSSMTVVCRIKGEAAAQLRKSWERQAAIVYETALRTLAWVLAVVLLLGYLFCVCGKTADGECRNMWIDAVWLEVHLAVMAGAGIGAVLICALAVDEYMSGHFPLNLLRPVIISATALGSLLVITPLLSLIRNIKAGRFLERSILLRIARWLIRLTIRILKGICRITVTFWRRLFGLLSKKTGVIFLVMLFVYTALIGLLGIGTVVSPVWLIVGVLLFLLAGFVLACRAKDLDEIKQGVGEVRSGNVGYKIPAMKCEDMKLLAADINDIAAGLDAAVAAKVRAERMKSELITNVSHDLKTPITSIITYTELLAKAEGLPEDARDYVAVIAKKSERLKNLTQDLFDISRVQSGNDEVTVERLDVALLINQAIGELDGEIRQSGLTFCVSAPKELCILADGRKMSRVLGNLIQNILKYTLKNTRVFITAAEKNGTVEIELKNISAYPLDFDPEEITARFVRGDASRTAEGNGLGLAIAKSYTEICGGSFRVETDGDMFKAILSFEKAQKPAAE
ncbi:MAG: HAMP domain-containing histidine kinase [Clostridia bacterium]|nr:HAMP domain-containing histidine kinase [Clostridia bacterium]